MLCFNNTWNPFYAWYNTCRLYCCVLITFKCYVGGGKYAENFQISNTKLKSAVLIYPFSNLILSSQDRWYDVLWRMKGMSYDTDEYKIYSMNSHDLKSNDVQIT